ncbi:MAG: hypothetical protein PHR77_10595 [Kiritimatiellae bacterium]|nr:hypothetical protein [Kiritimatiellia bacterium]MDD5522393.1 hypothetical protein [Kiritimatiellia bacterium]
MNNYHPIPDHGTCEMVFTEPARSNSLKAGRGGEGCLDALNFIYDP